MQALEGMLLGDSSLIKPPGPCDAYFSVGFSDGRITVRDHLKYLLNTKAILEDLGVEVPSKYPDVTSRIQSQTGKPFNFCYLHSLSSSVLTREHARWYLSGAKEVPEDLILAPASLGYWFMEDGGSSRHSIDKTVVYVTFATYGFNVHSVSLLIEKLAALGLFVTKPYRDKHVVKGSGLRLILRQESADLFMELVDRHVTEPYRYKIKRKESI